MDDKDKEQRKFAGKIEMLIDEIFREIWLMPNARNDLSNQEYSLVRKIEKDD